MSAFLDKIFRHLRSITGGKPAQQDLITPQQPQVKSTSFGADLVRVMNEQGWPTASDSYRHPGGQSVKDFNYIHEPGTGGSSVDVVVSGLYETKVIDCTASNQPQGNQCCGKCQHSGSNVVQLRPQS